MQLSEIDSIVREFLLSDDAGTAKYAPDGGGDSEYGGVEVLPGLLYRYRQNDPESRPVGLQVFAGLGELVAQLWDQEVKVLLRVASMRHPALPEVINGGHVPPDKIAAVLGYRVSGNVAYVRTRADHAIEAADIAQMTAAMHSDRVHALRQFWLLADALGILHDARIAHRNLWPGTLQAYQEADADDKWSLRLSRFEMSALLSNILRAGSVDSAGGDVVRDLYLRQEPQALRYAPPERLRFLLEDGDGGQEPLGAASTDRGDVFSLAMIAAEWFIGGFPADRDPCAAPGGRPGLTELLELQGWVRKEVRTNENIPAALGALLDDMLDPRASDRPTTSNVLQRLSQNYDGIVSLLEGTVLQEPYLLLYLPETSRNLVEWGWLEEEDPVAVRREIAQDLRGALVVESPEGAEPYVANWRGDSPEKLRQARWVLIGKRAAWFCRPYELKTRAFGAGEPLTNVYVIGYVAVRERAGAPERERLNQLEQVPLQRRVGSVEVESDQIAASKLEQRRRDRPHWTDLFRTVAQPVPLSPQEQEFAQALEFLLQYQGAQLQARTYAFKRDENYQRGADTVVLRWDRERDQRRRDRLPALHAKLLGPSSGLRLPFAQFFEEVSHGTEDSQPRLRVDRDEGRVSGESRVGEFLLAGTRGEDTVVLTGVSRVEIPENGLISPAGDNGSFIAIRRQSDARNELVRNRILVNRLMRPRSIKGDLGRWAGARARSRERAPMSSPTCCPTS